MQGVVEGSGRLFGMRSGHGTPGGCGGKYCAKRVAGSYGFDALFNTMFARFCVVVLAGVVSTFTVGSPEPGTVGTNIFLTQSPLSPESTHDVIHGVVTQASGH